MSFYCKKIKDKFLLEAPASFAIYLDEFGQDLAAMLCDFIADSSELKNCDGYTNMYLYEPLNRYLSNAGKMHRPLTCMAAYFACGGCADDEHFEQVVKIALCFELFQSAALIHDDIADEAELRRGKPCLHRSEGEAIALNAGDYALSAVCGNLISDFRNSSSVFDAEKTLRILHELTQMEYRTIEGQATDLGWARDSEYDLKVDDYFDMASHKTAYYSAVVPCAVGAICADASDELIEDLRNFGMKVGLAFQIQDDLLNLIGNDKSKDFQSDIVEGKRTLMAVYALNNAPSNDKAKLQQILSAKQNTEEEKAEAVEIMQNCGALKYSEEKCAKFAEEANQIISIVLPESR